MGIEILVLDYNSKHYSISKYDTERMMFYEKANLINKWKRRISREINIRPENLRCSFYITAGSGKL